MAVLAECPFCHRRQSAKSKQSASKNGKGCGADHFTLAVGHTGGEEGKKRFVVDSPRARRESDMYSIVKEYSELLGRYRVNELTGDRFAGSSVVEAFEGYGITYEVSSRSESQLYIDSLT